MPKVIENLRDQLLAEAQRQISERGYASTTIRSIARACGVAAGTVYNYFPSKEVLIATFMAEDWNERLLELRALQGRGAKETTQAICEALRGFTEKHKALFSDTEAEKTFAAVFPTRHRQLRAQIAELMAPFFGPADDAETEFGAQFAAESILTWMTEGVSFDRLWSILSKLVQTKVQGGIPNEQL